MTDQEVYDFYEGRSMVPGPVQFSSFERTDDATSMVKMSLERMRKGGQGADTAKGVLIRLAQYLKGSHSLLQL